MRHLSRWAKNRILFSNGTKRYAIAKLVGDGFAPVLKLLSRPFKPMVLVPEFPRGKVLELHVVFHVRGRNDDAPGLGKFEENPFKRRQTGIIEVLDHLHDDGRVVAGQTLVAITQRSL